MAATVNLGQQLQFENVKHLPPRAPSANGRPCSGFFHNRGRLFPTLKQQPNPSSTASGQGSGDGSLSVTTCTSQSIPVTSSPKDGRVRSAKARLETTQTRKSVNNQLDVDYALAVPGSDVAVYDVNRNLVIDHKPRRQNSRGSTDDSSLQNTVSVVSYNKPAVRPSSAKSPGLNSTPISPAVDVERNEENVPEDLKPSVFGYRLKRQVYGSNPDIFSSSLLALQPATMFKLDEPGDGHSQKKTVAAIQEWLHGKSHLIWSLFAHGCTKKCHRM